MKRPTGVTIIGIFEIIAGFIGLIGGICAGINLLVIGIAAGLSAATTTMSSIFTASGIVILAAAAAFLVVFVGGLEFFVGIGLLQLQPWAWGFTLFVAVVAIIIGLVSIVLTLLTGQRDPTTSVLGPVITVIIQAIIIWYLRKPEVKLAFGVA